MASLFRPVQWTVLAAALLPFSVAAQTARVGAAAPDFTATDSHGQSESLNQYHGKFVVLEWHNQGCPLHAQALRIGKHAVIAEGMDRERGGLVHGDFVGAG